MSRYIEAYVQQVGFVYYISYIPTTHHTLSSKINPANAAIVVGALMDSNCNDDYIKKLVMSIRGLCPVEALVEETGTQ